MESVGNLALVTGYRSFDPTKAASLSTWLFKQVTWAIAKHMDPTRTAEKRHGPKLSLDFSVNDGTTIGETIAAAPDSLAENTEEIRHLLKKLPPLIRAVYVLRIVHNMEFEDIASRIGKSLLTAKRYFRAARAKVARRLAAVKSRKIKNMGKRKPPPPPVSEAQKKAAVKFCKELAATRRALGDFAPTNRAYYLADDGTKTLYGPFETMKNLMEVVGIPSSSVRTAGVAIVQNNNKLALDGRRVVRGPEAHGLCHSNGYLVHSREALMSTQKLPTRRRCFTHKVVIGGDNSSGPMTFYLTTGEFEDGRLGEVFIVSSKMGTFVQGILDSLARLISVSLQDGVSVDRVVHALRQLDFPPNGSVEGSDVSKQTTSVSDWVSQELHVRYGSGRQIQNTPVIEGADKSFGFVYGEGRSGV